MQIGVVYPQNELAPDPTTVRRYLRTIEDLGYRHLLAYDHVLGVDREAHPGFKGPYDVDTMFHEPLVFFGFVAALTDLELVTGVIIGPQRQTALLAKQAAEVDVLCNGRFRLGLGVGWNAIEFEALGQDFSTRGKREEEQIELMRRLWTERSVTFEGRFDRVPGAGLLPRPVQQPIPIWLGGSSPAAYDRIGRMADGWFPLVQPGEVLEKAIEAVAEAARAAGNDPGAIGMHGRQGLDKGGLDGVITAAGQWRELGATHLSINTMYTGMGADLDAHLDALAQVATALEL